MTRFEKLFALRYAATALAFLVSASPAFAKCQTSELAIRSSKFSAPLIVSGDDTAGQFNIWNGPNVRMNNEAIHLNPAYTQGNFIDWSSGPLAIAPKSEMKFQIAFFCRSDVSSEPRKMYAVDYSFSPDSIGGFIYLPGQDDSRYALNVSTIAHRVEGSWYRSTDDWETVIRPILVDAIKE